MSEKEVATNHITNEAVKEKLYEKYIRPTEKARGLYAGIEVELPIANLQKEAVDFDLVHELSSLFGEQFGFSRSTYDDRGNILALEHSPTGDLFTFDCSYNTIELALGTVEDLHDADRRLKEYLEFIQNHLQKKDHLALGMGINPYREYISYTPIENGRYRMLHHHLMSYKKHIGWKNFFDRRKKFAPYPDFGMFSAASQVQIDVMPGKVIQTMKVFDGLEPFKSALFANSPMEKEELLLARDWLWANSMHGFNPRNVGVYDPDPNTEEELLDYMLKSSIYCAQRDGKYYNFTPLPLEEYFKKEKISADYFGDKRFRAEDIIPGLEDLAYFRTYKFQDLTYRGTIEFRSVCAQPLRERMTMSAFHLGLVYKLEELEDLLQQVRFIHGYDLSNAELRTVLNRESWPEFLSRSVLSKTLLEILALARQGLRERGKGEEEFLKPLFTRAEALLSPAWEYTTRLRRGEKLEDIMLDFSALD